MNTEYGTNYDVDQIGIVVWHQNEDHPLWLTREDLEAMIKALTQKEDLFSMTITENDLKSVEGFVKDD